MKQKVKDEIKIGDIFRINPIRNSMRPVVLRTNMNHSMPFHNFGIEPNVHFQGHTFKDEDGSLINQNATAFVDESGFYKVVGINLVHVDDVFGDEQLELKLEKVAPLGWHNKENPEQFFIALKKLGFTVVSRDILCPRYDEHYVKITKKERAWLAVSPERGCIISTVEHDGKFDYCEFQFVYYTEQTRAAMSRIANMSSSDQYEIIFDDVAPNILDVLKDIRMSDDPPVKSGAFFYFPFSEYLIGDKRPGHEDKGIYAKYYAMNRKYFDSLPGPVKDFLYKRTDVRKYFSQRSLEQFVR